MTYLFSVLQTADKSYIMNSNENIITREFDVKNKIKQDKVYNKIKLNKILKNNNI